jgi:hypothetical protein
MSKKEKFEGLTPEVILDAVFNNASETQTTGEESETIVEMTALNDANGMSALNAKLANALSIDSSSLFTTIDTADGGKLEVTKKTYQFANPVGKRDSMTIYDTAIIESMEKISHALHGKAILTYAICKEFSKIAASGKLENMGFKTIADFGKAVYGLETSTVNHYTRIGSTFINDDYSVKAGLPDLSVSHFIELSSSVGDDGDITPIIELYTNGTLVDGMSTKRIRETLKTLSSGTTIEEKKSATTTGTTKNENTGEAILTTSDVTELDAHFDAQVVIGKIISGCTVIEQLFDMLGKNEISAIGYAEHIDALKAIAKALL